MHLGGTKPRCDLNCIWTEIPRCLLALRTCHSERFLGSDSYGLLSLNPKKVAVAGHLLVTLPLIATRAWRDNFSLCDSAAVCTQGLLQPKDTVP